jgi:dTDP-4-amino-4,6-dideoxygalactose transaminase
MQFVDLAAQQREIKDKIDANIQKVHDHGKYIMGPEVTELEERLAEYVGVKHCIGCSSGTDALLMALMAKGVGPGDAIFTTPFTFIATAEGIALLGATPVFVDIAPKTFNIDPDKLALAIEALKAEKDRRQRTEDGHLITNHRLPTSGLTPKGIITVDLFGLACEYDKINAIAQDHGLFVIEDAAQGLGGEYNGKMACTLAEIGCTSFFPAKPLGCYGDGGAVFTDDDGLAETMGSIRVHGKGTHKYDNARVGLNARLDTLQAAILLAKLDIFPEEIEERRQIAQRYTQLLSAGTHKLTVPFVPQNYKSVWAQYSVLAESEKHRSGLQQRLKENGIPTAIYYPKPLHLQSAFSTLDYKSGDFPISEDCAERIFSLPMHPYLADKDIERICDVLEKNLA